MPALDSVVNQAVALLLGGIAGGLFGAVALALTWWWDSTRRAGHELYREGLEVLSSAEAWILKVPGLLSQRAPLDPFAAGDTEKLERVEVRAVLDQASWNAPARNFFGFIAGRRTWIVRDAAEIRDSYVRPGNVEQLRAYPALLSSKALHELAALVQRVSALCLWRIWPLPRRKEPLAWIFLPDQTLRALWPILAPLCAEDRIALLSGLSSESKSFLRWYRDRYPELTGHMEPVDRLQVPQGPIARADEDEGRESSLPMALFAVFGLLWLFRRASKEKNTKW